MEVGARETLLPGRVCAAMLFSGAALLVVGVLLPPAAEHSDAMVLGIAGIAVAAGAALWLTRTSSELALGGATLVGTALITATLYEAGDSGSADDVQIVYLWVCLFAFYFFRTRHALAQLAVVGIAYAAVLTTTAAPETIVPSWLTTMGTLLVAGLVITRLRGSLERSVGELARRARLDALTGLLNRRALTERAAIEFARARREHTPTSVIQIDVDRFKALNDTFGHPVGDRVLQVIASALDSQTRPTDAVARVGGDEFAVLLPGTSAAEAREISDRLRAATEYDLDLVGIRAAISIGVATVDGPPVTSFEQLWAAADAAMYEAKRSGGDRVRSAPAPAIAAPAGA
jgi:diguanylate cyclase (GGDEF)-like protein